MNTPTNPISKLFKTINQRLTSKQPDELNIQELEENQKILVEGAKYLEFININYLVIFANIKTLLDIYTKTKDPQHLNAALSHINSLLDQTMNDEFINGIYDRVELYKLFSDLTLDQNSSLAHFNAAIEHHNKSQGYNELLKENHSLEI